MSSSDIRRLIDRLPEDKKKALAAALEGNTGISQDRLAEAVKDPETAQKLSRLAEKIDPAALEAVTSDPRKLKALLSSPQVKNALKGFIK